MRLWKQGPYDTDLFSLVRSLDFYSKCKVESVNGSDSTQFVAVVKMIDGQEET